RRSSPSSATRPLTRPGRGTRRRIESAVRLFPDPDSPTRPTISPRATESETPRTASTGPALPGGPGKLTRRSERVRRSGAGRGAGCMAWVLYSLRGVSVAVPPPRGRNAIVDVIAGWTGAQEEAADRVPPPWAGGGWVRGKARWGALRC